MKCEIGGYLEFERFYGEEYHHGAIRLNLARNALVYLIKAKKVKFITIPYYLCDSMQDVCERHNVQVRHYHIDENFQPVINMSKNSKEYVLIVNFFGQLNIDSIRNYLANHLIIDSTQAFFEKYENMDAIYSCRKFFGVPDGAYLYTDKEIKYSLKKGKILERMSPIIGRFESTAEEYFENYREMEKHNNECGLCAMSDFSRNMMRGIDYEFVRHKRRDNFCHLKDRLDKYNMLRLKIPEGPFMYPFYNEKSELIREHLLKEQVYVPKLWREVEDKMDADSTEYKFAKNIIPLPVDQRYGLPEMEKIVSIILRCIGVRMK